MPLPNLSSNTSQTDETNQQIFGEINVNNEKLGSKSTLDFGQNDIIKIAFLGAIVFTSFIVFKKTKTKKLSKKYPINKKGKK